MRDADTPHWLSEWITQLEQARALDDEVDDRSVAARVLGVLTGPLSAVRRLGD